MGNRAVLKVKYWILIGSNFYVNNDFAKDSMKMPSECRFH